MANGNGCAGTGSPRSLGYLVDLARGPLPQRVLHGRWSVLAEAVRRAHDPLTRGDLYRRNVSVAGLINHWQIGRNFARESRSMPPPDLILCSFPTIELSLAASAPRARARHPHSAGCARFVARHFSSACPALVARPRCVRCCGPYFAATRRALSGADAIIAVSGGLPPTGDLQVPAALAGRRIESTRWPTTCPGRRTRHAPQGLEVFRSFGVKSDCIVCLFAGTLGRTYDLAPVLECATGLARNTRSRFHFVICGDGERAREWRKRAADLPNMTFTGWLEQDAMRAALAAADIGLAAYAQAAPQGLPNKVIEYLAAGLPVISSLRGETERLLSEDTCGITYLAADAASFGEALFALEAADVRGATRTQRATDVRKSLRRADRLRSARRASGSGGETKLNRVTYRTFFA